jgi:hypothetical protein
MTLAPGSRLRLEISDPFELSQVLAVRVAAVDALRDGAEFDEYVLVDLPTPLLWNGRTYQLVLAGRSAPGFVEELELGQTSVVSGYGTHSAPADGSPWGVDT